MAPRKPPDLSRLPASIRESLAKLAGDPGAEDGPAPQGAGPPAQPPRDEPRS